MNEVKEVNVTDVVFDKSLDITEAEIDVMAASIVEVGQLHPITVYMAETRLHLGAGERRLRAFQKLRRATISALVIDGEVSKERAREIHLHETLKRFNLSWYDQVELELELHEMRQKQHGAGRVGGGGKVGWSLRNTADELQRALGALSEDIQLANAIKNDPTLKNIKDRKTALRVIQDIEKRGRMRLESGVTSIEDQVLLGDSEELLNRFPSATFHACITDPPWLEYKDTALTRDEQTIKVFPEIFRVLRYDSFLYCFVGVDDFFHYRAKLGEIGFVVQKLPLIWAKDNVLTYGRRSWEYGRNYELILLAVKGSPALVESAQLNPIFNVPAIHSTKLIHPNEKPLRLIELIIDHCTYSGGVILDPFAGSGVVGEAARNSGRKYVLIERDRKFFDGIGKRLAKSRVNHAASTS